MTNKTEIKNGTEKQIAWAENIRASYEKHLPDVSSNPVLVKIVEAFLSIEHAEGWIGLGECRDPKEALAVMRILSSEGIQYKGTGFSDHMVANVQTGEITYK